MCFSSQESRYGCFNYVRLLVEIMAYASSGGTVPCNLEKKGICDRALGPKFIVGGYFEASHENEVCFDYETPILTLKERNTKVTGCLRCATSSLLRPSATASLIIKVRENNRIIVSTMVPDFDFDRFVNLAPGRFIMKYKTSLYYEADNSCLDAFAVTYAGLIEQCLPDFEEAALIVGKRTKI